MPQEDGYGLPSIPKTVESFQLPNGMSIVDYKVTAQRDTFSIKLTPAILPIAESQNTSEENIIEPYKGLWPKQCAEYIGYGTYRDVRIAQLELSPAQYDYENEQIIFNRSIELEIYLDREELSDSSENYESESVTHTLSEDDVVQLTTIQLPMLESAKLPGTEILPEHNIVRAPDYLIVTTSDFLGAAEQLAEWKRRMGYNVTISSKNHTFFQDPDNTKRLIRGEYQKREDLQYVLLLGGGFIIVPNTGKFTYTNKQYSTDHYFACMDGDDDLIADVCIGRLPAHTLEEAYILVNKTISYERNPPISEDYFERAVHAASFDHHVDKRDEYADFREDRRFTLTSEEIRNYLTDKGWNITRCYKTEQVSQPKYWSKDYSDGSEIPEELQIPNFSWDANAESISASIESGASYFLFRGHGNINLLGTVNFSSNNAADLGNKEKLPFGLLITCLAGTFHKPNSSEYNSSSYSISEKFLCNPNGGLAGIIGANQVSYSGLNDIFVEVFFDGAFPNPGISPLIPGYKSYFTQPFRLQEQKIGHLFRYSMSRMFQAKGVSETLNRISSTRYNREIFHCLADPTLPFYSTNLVYKPSNSICENNEEIVVDNRDWVMVHPSTKEVLIYKAHNRRPVEKWMRTYQWSFVGNGYVPYVVGVNDISIQNNRIDNVTTYNGFLVATYTSTSNNVMFYVYDIDGTLVDEYEGENGMVALNYNVGSTNTLVMSVNGVVMDTKVIR